MSQVRKHCVGRIIGLFGLSIGIAAYSGTESGPNEVQQRATEIDETLVGTVEAQYIIPQARLAGSRGPGDCHEAQYMAKLALVTA